MEWNAKELRNLGIWEYGFLDPRTQTYHESIRDICKGNVCRNYNTTWACPPAIGTIEECRERCAQYNIMLLFTGRYDLEDSFDFEGMQDGMHEFKKTAKRLDAFLQSRMTGYQVLANEGCNECKSCTYPENPCRHPQSVHHSLEGYGLIVSELAKAAQIKYNNGPNTVTYFGAVLYNQ